MNHKLLWAVLASVAPFVPSAVRADDLPDQIFLINTPAAGIVDFKGVGTATFSQSQGSNQSMTVGSNSSFGVNAAASNSNDYSSFASATLNLTEESTLKQINGTAANAFNSYLGQETPTVEFTNPDDGSTVMAQDNVSTINAIIKKDPVIDVSNALEHLSDSFNIGATASANNIHGDTYDPTSADYSSEADYDAQWQKSYSEAYMSAYSSAAADFNGMESNDSEVSILGLGSLSDLTTQASSTFTAESDRLTESATGDEDALGNATAQANLSSTSYVNIAEANTASGFMQAFHGSAPQGNFGDLTLVGVEDNNDGTYSVVGYRTVTQTETYTTDTAGDITGAPAVNQESSWQESMSF